MRYSFVRNIREKRKKEINNYELKGYILNKNNYITNDILQININGIIFKYGIRVNGNDVYFYILKEGCQIYLKIYDIYLILWKLYYKENNKQIIDFLEYYENNSQGISFSYEGVNYFVHQLPKIDENIKIGVLDSDVEITLEELFLLIYLIQDKSNYLISLGKKTEYINGIIRMLTTLLKCNNKNDILETIGWFFDYEKCYYILNSKDFLSEKKKRMNYLTEYEESLIL